MSRLALIPVALAISLSPVGVHAQSPSASCATFDVRNEPSSTFQPGEQIFVRGTGFQERSLVLVSFQQDTRSVELTRVSANDLGAFATAGDIVPDSLHEGPAVVRAMDSMRSATCEVSIETAADGAAGGDLSRLYQVWGAALVLFGLFLAVVTYRRWKRGRLREQMEVLAQSEVIDVPRYDEPWEPERRRRGATRVSVMAQAAKLADAPQGPLLPDEDDEDDGYAYPAEVHDDDDAEDDHSWRPEDPIQDPPILPEGWDEGRLRPQRPNSEVIARLRREVRTWRSG